MSKEYKTLRELDVDRKDVVEWESGTQYTIWGWEDGECYPFAEDGGPDDVRLAADHKGWRIVSRASDTPKPYTPGERQAVAEYPRASVSPDHAWEPKPTTPKLLRDMTDAEIGALVRAKNEGKVIEIWDYDEWLEAEPQWKPNNAYRVRPEPNRKTVTYTWGEDVLAVSSLNREGTHHITFDLIDGKPDCDSIKMEEL